GMPMEAIFRTRPMDSESKYISTRALLTSDGEGSPVNLTGVCFDVTGMKRGAEKAIVKLNEELLRSNKELESFAYVASHDLQEPLRMISSFTQMLDQRYGDKLDQDAHDYIGFAVDGAKRMYDLLNGLLAYSRIHSKAREFTDVDMSVVFEKVTRNLSLRISERNAEIIRNELPVIKADESQIIQLVQNLFENSIKFSSGNPKITFAATTEADQILFSVKDEGMGIEPQYFDRIFKIFQRLQPKEDYEGTGIGLAICKRIVDRHKGKIWVESEPGKGSEFYFTIPRKSSDSG
ncbi:MAG: ATP-binding protein, partial [Bacteroidales bacterium]